MSNEIKYVNEAGVRRIVTDTRDHIADISEAAYTGHKIVFNFPAVPNKSSHSTDDFTPRGASINNTNAQVANFTLPFQISDNYTLLASWHLRGKNMLTVDWSISNLPEKITYNGDKYTILNRNPHFTDTFDLDLDVIQPINESKSYYLTGKSGSLHTVTASRSTGQQQTETIDVMLAGNLEVHLPIIVTNQSITVGPLDLGASKINKMGVAGTSGQSVGPYTPSAHIDMSAVNYPNTVDIHPGPITIEAVKIIDATGFNYWNEGH